MGPPAMLPIRLNRGQLSRQNNTPKKVKNRPKKVDNTPKRAKNMPNNFTNKIKKRIQENMPPVPKMLNLPGKPETKVKKLTKKVSGRCAEVKCQLIWESKRDKSCRKQNGMRKTSWIGCDAEGCTFWGHASCIGMVLVPKKKIEDHKLLCSKHKQK